MNHILAILLFFLSIPALAGGRDTTVLIINTELNARDLSNVTPLRTRIKALIPAT